MDQGSEHVEPAPPPPPGQGEAAAWGEALKRHRSWLGLLARLQVGNRYRTKFDPSDAVQQTMLEAVKAWPQFRGTTDAELAAWLRAILARVLAHEFRRFGAVAKRAANLEISLDDALAESSRKLGNALAAPGTSPSGQFSRHERELQLADALAKLPSDYREVIVLRHFEGLSHEDIAQRLNRNPGAARMLWVRALARLRKELDQLQLSE